MAAQEADFPPVWAARAAGSGQARQLGTVVVKGNTAHHRLSGSQSGFMLITVPRVFTLDRLNYRRTIGRAKNMLENRKRRGDVAENVV